MFTFHGHNVNSKQTLWKNGGGEIIYTCIYMYIYTDHCIHFPIFVVKHWCKTGKTLFNGYLFNSVIPRSPRMSSRGCKPQISLIAYAFEIYTNKYRPKWTRALLEKCSPCILNFPHVTHHQPCPMGSHLIFNSKRCTRPQ